MVKRNNHYDAAFEEYLRHTRTPYVAVDEKRRAQLCEASLKSMDFIVTAPCFQNVLVDVKGRRFPSGGDGPGGAGFGGLAAARGRTASEGETSERRAAGHKWENWATTDDLDSLLRWQAVFGNGFRSALVFAYEILEPRLASELSPAPPFVHRGRLYSFFGVWADEYREAMRVRSTSWDTVTLPSRRYRDLRFPFSDLLSSQVQSEACSA